MRILLLSQWCFPEPEMKGLVFARSLQGLGHSVEVLTGFPNYPQGKIYSGYKLKWRQKEVIDGVNITRVFLYPSHDNSAIKRSLSYISFAVSSCLHGLFTKNKFDVIYVYHPPLTAALSGAIIGKLRKIPFVIDIQDMWPDTLSATGMVNNVTLLNFVAKICKWIYRTASHIVVLSPGFKELLIKRNVPAEKIDVIYNWCEENLQTRIDNDTVQYKAKMADRFNVVFAGNMGRAQALEGILSVAKNVAEVDKRIQFVFIGDGVERERLKQFSKEQKLENVLFLPRIPGDQIGEIFKIANVLLVHLKDDPLFAITIPSKTQAYMAAGRPILMAVRGDAASLIQAAKAGYCALPEDKLSITNAVLALANLSPAQLAEMGENAKCYYMDNLGMDIGLKKFVAVFEKVINRTNIQNSGSQMKILTVFGTRPEAIKMAPIILTLRKNPKFKVEICLTAQHRHILDQEMQFFGLTSDYDLNIMQPDQDLFDITTRALVAIKPILEQSNPDYVAVLGDTTSVFVGALAAVYKKIPVIHIESGLRTGDLSAPFPEEMNRVIASRIAKLHFAPTENAKENLLREGVDANSICVSGNTVIDALFWAKSKVATNKDWGDTFGSAQKILATDAPVILVTCHRRENFGAGVAAVCDALLHLAQKHPSWHFVYPVHPNPNVNDVVKSKLAGVANIHLLVPQGYAQFVYLMDRAHLILTDSGGIQEEGPALGKPVLVMRDVTERPEAVAAGTAVLVGANPQKIIFEVEDLMQNKVRYEKMARAVNPFGDGHASAKIMDWLVQKII